MFRKFNSAIQKKIADTNLVANEITGLSVNCLKKYKHHYQYHNAEHALNVAMDSLKLTSCLEEKISSKKYLRLIISSLYHDIGNGKYPKAGIDEYESVNSFLKDTIKVPLLKKLLKSDILQISSSILSTVFHDRYCDAALLKNQKYILKTLKLLKKYNIKTDQQKIISLMCNTESWIIKNADIFGSLKKDSILKNNFTNYWENLLSGKFPRFCSAKLHRELFVKFIVGKIHKKSYQKDTKFSLKANEKYILITPNNSDKFPSKLEKYGKYILLKSEKEFHKIITIHHDILNYIHYLMYTSIKKNRKTNKYIIKENILRLPISNIIKKIRKNQKNIKIASNKINLRKINSQNYPQLFNKKNAHKSIVDLTGKEISILFAPNKKVR
ncbi:hypothetical protein A2483_00485 [Candidatus Peregrinibacteria bacterium RIFOXYC2_FULL_33_13]|nr:MAG: hypothetical protein UR27_C0008G0016 [Candidatus Peregrinibacteria bacterium GW2011_GWA2_33_10]KKP38991.1 MAG: hypothetical protein UR30_C0013G0015 [Candidatus Peregrinibacteria bacterium GW2011_GWC2_33_13]OGJ49986.1 MAG: hypothetical protein A2229_02905 [Candidatus Peregrinibacteria bacterium RIFOXYA2_FULL_33_7]OGJ53385.1 MAG: hypothetical protein A2483_00485 [Candidatus Peregrinibacteria bacterium RIFOXYC2_FULL_33_13]